MDIFDERFCDACSTVNVFMCPSQHREQLLKTEKDFRKKRAVSFVKKFVHCTKNWQKQNLVFTLIRDTLLIEHACERRNHRCTYTRDVHARPVVNSCPDRQYGGRTKIRRSIHVTITLTSQVGYSYRCTGAPMPSRFRHAMLRGCTHEFSRDTIRKCTIVTIVHRHDSRSLCSSFCDVSRDKIQEKLSHNRTRIRFAL